MKRWAFGLCYLERIAIISLSILMAVAAVDGEQIYGQVATGSFQWNASNFAGFYYDIDDGLGTEVLTTTITDSSILQEPGGIIYASTTQRDGFDFAGWGFYSTIGFQGRRYFAGYASDGQINDSGEILFYQSADKNTLNDEQLEEILIDSDDEIAISSGTLLVLDEGYELFVKSVDLDGEKVYLELSRNGSLVDSKIISPSEDNSSISGSTYCYKKDVGYSEDLVTIAVHLKNVFSGIDQGLATIDGIWQISDMPVSVRVGTNFGRMRISSVTADTITMDNKDNAIFLGRGRDILLMGDIMIITSDQDEVNKSNPLRYCIAKSIADPGTYEVRGAVARGSFEWNASNFAGFYYDIDDDLGTEKIITNISLEGKLQEPDGIVYNTTAQKNDFAFAEWGFYNAIAFLSEEYFAGYINDENVDDADEILFNDSDERNLLYDEQLTEILIDSDDEHAISSNTPLELEEGYELTIESIDIDGNKLYLELAKDGLVVDRVVISPSKDLPAMSDRTYCYRKDVGGTKNLVTIAVHFKNAFRSSDRNLATIDGIWQISENPIEVRAEAEYGRMRISRVDGDRIIMDNKDNNITMRENIDISLMGASGSRPPIRLWLINPILCDITSIRKSPSIALRGLTSVGMQIQGKLGYELK